MGARRELTELKIRDNEINAWGTKYWIHPKNDWVAPDFDHLYLHNEGELLTDPETIFANLKFFKKMNEWDFAEIVIAYLGRKAIREHPEEWEKFKEEDKSFIEFVEHKYGGFLNGSK